MGDNKNPNHFYRMVKLNPDTNQLETDNAGDAITLESSQPSQKRLIEVTVYAESIPLVEFNRNDGFANELTCEINDTHGVVGAERANLVEITNLDSFFGLTGTTLQSSWPGSGDYYSLP